MEELKFYNWSEVRLPTCGADSLTVKLAGASESVRQIETVESGDFVFRTDEWAPGFYVYQLKTAGAVTGTGRFRLLQDLEHAPDGFDPRSTAEITLDAIDAMLAGRATAQQRRVQVGDKSVEYSTISELKQWREYFLEQLAAEQGKGKPKRLLAVFDGGRYA